jgi:hypothetical protein
MRVGESTSTIHTQTHLRMPECHPGPGEDVAHTDMSGGFVIPPSDSPLLVAHGRLIEL